jgi:tetratricopeptide (TPR) repeat protein
MVPPVSPATPWFRRPAAWLFSLAFLARLLVLSRLAGTPYFVEQTGDMRFYDAWAQRILSGQFSDGHAFYGLPGYAYLLAAIYKVVGPDPVARLFAVGTLQALIEALIAVLIFRIARKSLENESSPRLAAEIFPALAALAWVAFTPAQAFSVILMPTCWLVCTYWYCVSQAMNDQPAPPWRRWPLLGLLIGVMAMMVATILFALPLLLLRIGLSVSRGAPLPRRFAQAGLAAVLLITGVFAGAAPAWIHNYFVVKDPVFLSAHSGLNFWMGNSPGANGYPKIPAGLRPGQEGLLRDSITWAETAAGHPLKRSEVSRYWSAKANEYIATYPEAWGRLMLVKLRNFWNAFQYDDISVVLLFRDRGVLPPGLSWGLVAALGLTGAVAAVARRSPARWVAAAVGLHMLAIMPVFVTERYRLAAAPGLIVLGAYALYTLWENLAARRWLPATALAAVSLVAAWFVSLPTLDSALWALAPYNVGVKELELAQDYRQPGRDAEHRQQAELELRHAEHHLATAYALVQGDPGILFALGNLWFEKGDPARAAAFYRRTLDFNPHFIGARRNLGALAVQARDWPRAAELLREAAREDPDNVGAHYLLALAYETLGQLDLARASAAKALQLRPHDPQFQSLFQRLNKAP